MEVNSTKILNITEDKSKKDSGELDKNLVNQFKFLIVIIFIILIIFLGLYVYNLIKCYLPKWRKKKLVDEERQVEIRNQ
jgi:hypothetical protein